MPSMEDLRTRKTKQAIENAMMELIEIMNWLRSPQLTVLAPPLDITIAATQLRNSVIFEFFYPIQS